MTIRSMTPKVQAPAIVVNDQDFQRNRVHYLRQATPDQRVVVQDAGGRVSLVAGGRLDPPDGE
jgi:hypothetical protein